MNDFIIASSVAHRYTVPTPHGEVLFAAHEKSKTVHRLMNLCDCGALPEFVKVYCKGAMHKCHDVAFEFVFAVTTTWGYAGLSHQDLGMWKWCVARRGVHNDDLHSWIEQDKDDEAFDAIRSGPAESDSTYIYVRPRQQLREEYRVKDVESRSFYDFTRWLDARDDYPLFAKYQELAATFSRIKKTIKIVYVGVDR